LYKKFVRNAYQCGVLVLTELWSHDQFAAAINRWQQSSDLIVINFNLLRFQLSLF